MNLREAENRTILRGVVGSTVHGLSLDGQDDRDEMGICVEPIEHLMGVRAPFQQVVHRTQPEGARSGPGDLDLVIYGLSKWVRLALAGNPSIMLLLFVPESTLTVITPAGAELRRLAPCFVGQNVLRPYLGYMAKQRKHLTERHKMPRRPELIAAHGFDTKYAGHLLRLGHQGIELATKGWLSLPMEEPARSRILAVRRGEVPEREVLEEAAALERRLTELGSALDRPPDRDKVERFVRDAYLTAHMVGGRVTSPLLRWAVGADEPDEG